MAEVEFRMGNTTAAIASFHEVLERFEQVHSWDAEGACRWLRRLSEQA